MPRTYTNYLSKAQWDDSKKISAREETVVSSYRKHFGQQLPIEQQHWTMCGAHFNENGALRGELGHMVESGLITPRQFYGVDKESKIIQQNALLYPDATWICSDFLEAMETASINNSFNPGIVNYDGVMELKFGVRYLKRIISFLNNNANKCLLVANFILKNPYRFMNEVDGVEIIKELVSIYAVGDSWTLEPRYYHYHGSGKRSMTWMGSFVLVKK